MATPRQSSWVFERFQTRHYRWSIFIGVCAALAALGFSMTTASEKWELYSQDARLMLRGPRSTKAKIVIVDIADTTLAAWPEPTIFWGRHYADIVRNAKRYGASSIAFDLIPTISADEYLETVHADPQQRPDRAFAQALRDAHGSVILSNLRNGSGEPVNPNPQFAMLPETEDHIGFVDLPETADGVARLAALYVGDSPIRPSFSALIAASIMHVDASRAHILKSLAGAEADCKDAVCFRINYTLSPFPRLPAERLAQGDLAPNEREMLRNSVLLVGITFRGSGDRHLALSNHYTDGVEINANAAATLVDRRALKRFPFPQECCLVAIASALALIFALFFRTTAGALLLFVCALSWLMIAFHWFVTADTFLPIVGPLGGMLAPYATCQIVASIEEARRRKMVERIFGRYVSPQIRNHLLRSPSNTRMGGEIREATVLFLDVRGVTSYSEGRDPSLVMSELNTLFRILVPAIDRHGGLLFTYTGDGFLAVFGAPYLLPTHSQAAVDAALEIVSEVRRWNTQSDGPIWKVGCGIHSGPVACGSLGINDRSEYTVIGDTVNLTARLEGLNKEFGSDIILSEATVDGLHRRPVLEGPVTQEIRGRKQRAVVYCVRNADENAASSSTHSRAERQ